LLDSLQLFFRTAVTRRTVYSLTVLLYCLYLRSYLPLTGDGFSLFPCPETGSNITVPYAQT
jgi:hypothetical protein